MSVGTTGAILIGAGVAAAGTAYSASTAAGATKDSTNAAISQQQSALNQQAALSKPYRDLGSSAIPTLQSLLGISSPSSRQATSPAGTVQRGGGTTGPGFDRTSPTTNIQPMPGVPGAQTSAGSITDTLRNMPGYQFLQQQGTEGAVNQASAMGLGLSGNTLEGLSKFNQGLADNQYQQFLGNIENVVGMGQSAAANQANNIGNAAANTSSLLINQGNTTAGIDANLGAGLAKIAGNTANQFAMQNTLAGLNNPNNNPSSWDTENPGNFQDFHT